MKKSESPSSPENVPRDTRDKVQLSSQAEENTPERDRWTPFWLVAPGIPLGGDIELELSRTEEMGEKWGGMEGGKCQGPGRN